MYFLLIPPSMTNSVRSLMGHSQVTTADVAVHAPCLPSAQCANSNSQVVTELHASVHSHLGACL